MKIKTIEQINEVEIGNTNFNMSVMACGYESRCRHIAEKYSINSYKNVCLSFSDRIVLARKENDRFFKNKKYEPINTQGNDASKIIFCIKEQLLNSSEPVFRILIDYSCMTKALFGGILHYFSISKDKKPLEVWMAYSKPKYHKCPQMSYNRNAGPIQGYASVNSDTPAEKGTALVLGLGCEKFRSEGIVEVIDPLEVVAFQPYPESNADFASDLKAANKRVLDMLSEKSIVFYNIMDFNETYHKLFSTCVFLRQNMRVILAPMGPKPFALATMLTSILLAGCDVWRVSGGSDEKPCNVVSAGEILLVKISFSPITSV